MTRPGQRKIMSRIEPDGFVGRSAELERLLSISANGKSIAVLAQPSAGASELLRQVYDRLFFEQGDVTPFYFELKATDGGPRGIAARFVHEFLMQAVAFGRKDPRIIDTSPPLEELQRLAKPSDSEWVDDVSEAFALGRELKGRAFNRNCFGIPGRMSSRGKSLAILVDSVHTLIYPESGEVLLEDLAQLASLSGISVTLSGYRRALYGKFPLPTLTLDYLSMCDAQELSSRLAASLGVGITEQTRDLLSVQLGGNPTAIGSIVAAAADKDVDLDNFEKFETVYTDELFGGRLGRGIDTAIASAVPDRQVRRALLDLLADSTDAGVPLKYIEKRLNMDGAELSLILDRLNALEIIDLTHATVAPNVSTLVRDHISATTRLNSGQNRALVVGDMLAANIRRAPSLMADVYRGMAALDLRELLEAFDGRSVGSTALDYGAFKVHRGLADEQVLDVLKNDEPRATLPRIAYTVAAESLYPALGQLKDCRAAVGMGIDDDGETVAIIAAEIRSKLEATRETADFWLDRLEMLATHCEFGNYRLWLVAPEGFDEEALASINSHHGYGSSRRQAELFRRLLDLPAGREAGSEEYEFVLPMGSDTELLSAQAAENVAEKHGLSPNAINQVKTALIEACINAAEHGLSPDGKIHQKFAVRDNKLFITVSNRGVRLKDSQLSNSAEKEQRRGWGLKLMRGLVDDVIVHETDDGTSITLVKNLPSQQ